MSSKYFLIIIGAVLMVMGVLALIPITTLSIEPAWYALLKIILGFIAALVAMVDKKQA